MIHKPHHTYKVKVIFLILIWCSLLGAQPLATNTGVALTLEAGGIITCEGGWLNQSGGTFRNSGVVYILGDMQNDDAGQFFIPAPQPGTLVLNGGSQTLSGQHPIRVDTIRLSGTAPKILATPLYVDRFLDLGSAELRTQTTFTAVRNPDPNAIIRVTGFVSSDFGGYLERVTDRGVDYLFPVGGHTPLRYRPAYITPTSGSPHRWAVRLANTDPTNESLPRSQRHPEICAINPLYYHYVDRLTGDSPADITCVYEPSDPVKGPIAQWDGGRWIPSSAVAGAYPNSWRVPAVSQFNGPQWAFSERSVLASLTASADTIESGEAVSFTAGASPSLPGLSYTWQPGDGSSLLGGPSFSYTYPVPGIYLIQVIVETSPGCADTAAVRLVVRPKDRSLFIPNVFSPNGDGINDYWAPIATGLKNAKWSIYDRWGAEITQGQGLPISWDGKKNGQACPEGVYTYVIELETMEGERLRRAGTITLLR